MKHKEEKKIQFGGWSKRPYKEVRKKLLGLEFKEEKPVGSLKRKKKCKFSKIGHKFRLAKESKIWKCIYKQYVCDLCGKHEFKIVKKVSSSAL